MIHKYSFFYTFFIFFIQLNVAELVKNDFFINYDELTWIDVENKRKNTVNLVHPLKIAIINISYKSITEPITANRLHEQRSVSHYDGWLKVLKANC